jgi:hypothetical protein
MFKKKTHEKFDVEETQEPTAPMVPIDRFRAEAEEHMARVDRLRLEHAASELGTTVAEMQAKQAQAAKAQDPDADAHVRESIRESEKASHAKHARH